MAQKNILVFSIALEGYDKLFKKCIESQKKYCLKYGYNYLVIDKAPRKLLPTEAAWLKVFLLKEALACPYEWVAFIDADCEIRGHSPSFIEDFKRFEPGKTIFMAHGFSGRINSGVIFMKNTLDAKKFLETIIHHGNSEVPSEDKALYENGHMIHYGKNHPQVQIIESEKWNNNQDLNSHSYIQHYSGGKLRQMYLIKNNSIKKSNKILSGINRIRKYFTTKQTVTSMNKMKSLIPFYCRTFPMLNCNT